MDGRPTFQPVPGSETEIPCELVLLAMGFVGPEREGVLSELGVELDARGNVTTRRATGRPRRRACTSAATWAGDRA